MDYDEIEISSDNSPTSQPSILMLNDDCLEHIFKTLDIKEQFQLSCACQRLHEIFKMVCKIANKTHTLGEPLWETREFFETAGPFIEELIGCGPYKYKDSKPIFELICNLCPNIQDIQFTELRIKSDITLLNNLTKITSLKLQNCSLNDNAILTIVMLPKLDFLSVDSNNKLTGKYLDRLKSVKQLMLCGCENILPTNFIDGCKTSFKALSRLGIQHCNLLTTEAYGEMATNCINLELLAISSWDPDVQYESVARLPRLKILVIHSCSKLRLKLFNELAEHKANQLECLSMSGDNCISLKAAHQIVRLKKLQRIICYNNNLFTDDALRKFGDLQNLELIVLVYCKSITNVGVLDLLRRGSKLKEVNIRGCPLITEKFALEITKLYKSKKIEYSK